MDKNYFIEYYTLEREHWWFKARMEILRAQVQALKLNAQIKILNVGVASGATSIMLQEFGTVKSIEYDEDCFEYVRKKIPELDIERGDILNLDYENESFDLVCSFDVLEHVTDDVKAAAELKRVCKSTGHVIVTVPYWNVLWGPHDEVNHHFRRYTKKQLLKLFNSDGKIVSVTFFNFYLFPFIAFFRIISKVLPKGFLRTGKNAGSDFSVYHPKWLDTFFFRLMRSEKYFIRKKIPLPVGVSLLLSFRKK